MGASLGRPKGPNQGSNPLEHKNTGIWAVPSRGEDDLGVHPTLIHAWKKQLLAGAEEVDSTPFAAMRPDVKR
jgi:hypothetical protein